MDTSTIIVCLVAAIGLARDRPNRGAAEAMTARCLLAGLLAAVLAACASGPTAIPGSVAYTPEVSVDWLADRWPYGPTKPGKLCRETWPKIRRYAAVDEADVIKHCKQWANCCLVGTTIVVAPWAKSPGCERHELLHVAIRCWTREHYPNGYATYDANHQCGKLQPDGSFAWGNCEVYPRVWDWERNGWDGWPEVAPTLIASPRAPPSTCVALPAAGGE